jgi:hypothetical protein
VTYLRRVARHQPVQFNNLLLALVSDDELMALMQMSKTVRPPEESRPAKSSLLLKQAILLAAQKEGVNGIAHGPFVAYLCGLARHKPRTFVGLLQKVLKWELAADRPSPRSRRFSN